MWLFKELDSSEAPVVGGDTRRLHQDAKLASDPERKPVKTLAADDESNQQFLNWKGRFGHYAWLVYLPSKYDCMNSTVA